MTRNKVILLFVGLISTLLLTNCTYSPTCCWLEGYSESKIETFKIEYYKSDDLINPVATYSSKVNNFIGLPQDLSQIANDELWIYFDLDIDNDNEWVDVRVRLRRKLDSENVIAHIYNKDDIPPLPRMPVKKIKISDLINYYGIEKNKKYTICLELKVYSTWCWGAEVHNSRYDDIHQGIYLQIGKRLELKFENPEKNWVSPNCQVNVKATLYDQNGNIEAVSGIMHYSTLNENIAMFETSDVSFTGGIAINSVKGVELGTTKINASYQGINANEMLDCNSGYKPLIEIIKNNQSENFGLVNYELTRQENKKVTLKYKVFDACDQEVSVGKIINVKAGRNIPSDGFKILPNDDYECSGAISWFDFNSKVASDDEVYFWAKRDGTVVFTADIASYGINPDVFKTTYTINFDVDDANELFIHDFEFGIIDNTYPMSDDDDDEFEDVMNAEFMNWQKNMIGLIIVYL